MRKTMTRSRKQHLMAGAVTAVVLALSVTAAYAATKKQVSGRYEALLQEKETLVQENTRMAYVASGDIAAGELISGENTSYETILNGTPAESLLGEEDMGKPALIDIKEKTPLLKTMAAPEAMRDDLKEEEFQLFNLNSNLMENDHVDIRLLYPNGENYIVLTKKALKNLDLEGNNCYLWLTEAEILSLSSAIVDAYLNEGSKLYTSRYIEPTIQEEATPTYLPNADVMQLIQDDPNVLEEAKEALTAQARAALESRLEKHQEKHGKNALDWETYSRETTDGEEPEEKTYMVDDAYGETNREGESVEDVQYVD